MYNLEKAFLPISVRRHNRESILELLAVYARPGNVVYDIGCGNKPYLTTVRALGCTYVGVDIAEGFYDEKPDLIGSASKVPVSNDAADLVISSQVIEHLEHPYEALKEAHRILKPGGILLYSSPFLYQLHATPYDYGRYTRYYIDSAAERLGFDVIKDSSLCGFWNASATLFANYARSFDRGLIKYTKIVHAIILLQQWTCVIFNIIEKSVLKLSRKNPLYFQKTWPVNNIFVMKKY